MNRLKYIDGIRGVLALVVFFHHFILMFLPAFYSGCTSMEDGFSDTTTIYKIIAYTPLNLPINGSFAVVFFFVLSGYILSAKHFHKQSLNILAQDIVKRYFRLVIPVTGSCFLIYFAHRLNVFHIKGGVYEDEINSQWLAELFKLDYSFWETINFSLSQAIFDKNTLYNSVVWTMPIEFKGSIIVFILLFVIGYSKRPLSVILFFSALIFVSGATRLLPFCFGISVAYLQFKTTFFQFPFIKNKLLLLLLFFMGCYLSSYPMAPDEIISKHIHSLLVFKNFQGMVLYESIGSILLLIAIIQSNWIIKLLSSNVFSFIGKISFGVYLTHLTLLASFSTSIFSLFYQTNTYNAATAYTFVLSLFVVIGAGYLFYFFIDKNTPKWSNLIAKKAFRF